MGIEYVQFQDTKLFIAASRIFIPRNMLHTHQTSLRLMHFVIHDNILQPANRKFDVFFLR